IPATGEIFYIGKGCSKARATSLVGRNRYWQRIVKKHGWKVEILAHLSKNEEACLLEKELIAMYRSKGQCAANLSEGGEAGFSGLRHCESAKKKMAEARLGKSHADSTIKKISDAQKGSRNHMYGKKH